MKLTFEDYQAEGYSYNYFDGYIAQHKNGCTLYLDDLRSVSYKGKSYCCNTIKDIQSLHKKIEDGII